MFQLFQRPTCPLLRDSSGSIYQKRCGIGSGIASEIAKRYHFDVDNDDSF